MIRAIHYYCGTTVIPLTNPQTQQEVAHNQKLTHPHLLVERTYWKAGGYNVTYQMSVTCWFVVCALHICCPYMGLLGCFPMLIANCLAHASNLISNVIHQHTQVNKNRLGCQCTFHESHVGFSYFPLIALCKNKYKRKIRKHSCMKPNDLLLGSVDVEQ